MINKNNIYVYYNLFFIFRVGILLNIIYSEFISTIKAFVVANNYLDYCGHIDLDSYFCKSVMI